MLHLLYHRDEMVAARQALLASYPDVMGLRHCYAHIRSVLNSRPYATKQDLLGSTREGYRITERVLKLFLICTFFWKRMAPLCRGRYSLLTWRKTLPIRNFVLSGTVRKNA